MIDTLVDTDCLRCRLFLRAVQVVEVIDLIPHGTGLETTNFHTRMLVSPEVLCAVYFRPECAYTCTCTRACCLVTSDTGEQLRLATYTPAGKLLCGTARSVMMSERAVESGPCTSGSTCACGKYYSFSLSLSLSLALSLSRAYSFSLARAVSLSLDLSRSRSLSPSLACV